MTAINFDQPLRTLTGLPFKFGDTPESPVFTLKDLALQCLLASAPGRETPVPLGKGQAFEFAMRLVGGGEIELKAEEIANLKKTIQVVEPAPILVGQAEKMLDGQATGLEPAVAGAD